MQLDLDLTHKTERSPEGERILNDNRKILNGENNLLLNFLLTGKRISVFNASDVGIGTLHSRISNVRSYLKENHSVEIKKQHQVIFERSCYEYYLLEEDVKKVKENLPG